MSELVDNIHIMPKTDDNVNHSPRAPGTSDEVLDLVHRVMHQLRSQQGQALREGGHEVTHLETKVLGYFNRHPGATQSELAQHSGRDKAQLARLLKGLRERGLLDAAADADDRRSVSLRLTPAGQALLRSLHQHTRRLNSRALAGFSAAEQQQLQALLQRMQANLEPPETDAG
jgi:DNA-binding MarR family transcriptional regulator